MTNNITCGIIVRRDGHVLLAHSTGMSWQQWNVPKGIADPGEAHIDAAVREMIEETAYVIDKTKLVDLGQFDYLPGKDIHLYMYDAPVDMDVAAMKCESLFFCDRKNMHRPECDSFKMVPFEKLPIYLAPAIKDIYYRNLKDTVEA